MLPAVAADGIKLPGVAIPEKGQVLETEVEVPQIQVAENNTSTSMVVDPKRRDSSTIHLFFAFLSFSSLFQTSLRLGASLGFLVDGFAFSARTHQI